MFIKTIFFSKLVAPSQYLFLELIGRNRFTQVLNEFALKVVLWSWSKLNNNLTNNLIVPLKVNNNPVIRCHNLICNLQYIKHSNCILNNIICLSQLFCIFYLHSCPNHVCYSVWTVLQIFVNSVSSNFFCNSNKIRFHVASDFATSFSKCISYVNLESEIKFKSLVV